MATDSVNRLFYSSMAAFVAHYRALSEAARANGTPPLSADERQTLAAMQPLVETLTAEERALVLADPGCKDPRHISAEARRRERTELKLRRLLLAQRVLRG
jgi:hypothetical protein